MKWLFSLVFALPLCAQETEDASTLSLLQPDLNKVEELISFSDAKVLEENREQFGDHIEQEGDDGFREAEHHIELRSSLVGIVEKETAELITLQEEEEQASFKNPECEDLSAFLKQPNITRVSDTPATPSNPYENLPITFEEKQKISEILMTMADNNVFQLLFHKKHLEKLGHEINHVHPVRFLGAVFSDPRLVHCMRQIKKSSFKWDGFIDGFGQRFHQELRANNVNEFVPGLAESLKVQVGDVQPFVDKKDFEGLVLFFMNKKTR